MPTILLDRTTPTMQCDGSALKLQYRIEFPVQQSTNSAQSIQSMCSVELYSSNYQSVTQKMLITQSSHLAEGKVCLASTPESQEDKQSGAFCVEQQ